jgi:sulfite reductase (ferredoxin)
MVNAEDVKRESHYLRGALPEELATDDAKFSDESEIVLKFHGIYQQDNRDVRRERASKKLPLDYICMVRASIPGGALTAEQYLVMDDLADEVGNGSLRITTRQGIQYHFTHKGELPQLVKTLNDNLVTTLAACGDVVRNTMYCPAPYNDRLHNELQELTQEIARRFRPKTESYYDVWVNGEHAVTAKPGPKRPAGGAGSGGDDEGVHRSEAIDLQSGLTAKPGPERPAQQEPLYKDVYLPRKFKIGVAFPGDNCVDTYTQDVGAVAHTDGEKITAFTIVVGGGFGVSHADDTTYPRIATPLTTVKSEEVADIIEAVIVVQRDHGERGDRKHARLKYTIDRMGLPAFKELVEQAAGRALPEPDAIEWEAAHDHLGWEEQGDGKWFLGIRVESGRILDRDDIKVRSALREIVERYKPLVRFTPNQDVIFGDIQEKDRTQIEAILRKAQVPLVGELKPLIRTALACVALPTCGLALTEAERVLPEILDGMYGALDELGLGDEPITFRMTGCPNGCARPYSSEIGFIGRGKTSYDILLGGNEIGDRLTQTYKKNIKRDQLINELQPLFVRFKNERADGERFGDWANRIGIEALASA